MEKTEKAAGVGSEEDEICRGKNGKWRCKNAIADNELHYCDKHYESWEMEKKKLPPDEERCCETTGKGIKRYRCKNFRMGYGAAAADGDTVPKTKRCERHYNYYVNYYKNLKEKKRSGDGEDSRGSKRRRMKRVIEEEDDHTSDIQGGSANAGTKRKEVERSGELDFRDFLIKKKEMEKKELPPDGQRCSQTGGGGWRCENSTMGHGAAAADDDTAKNRYCEKHYKYQSREYKNKMRFKKKTSGDVDQPAGSGPTIEETKTQKQWATIDDSFDTIVEEGGTGNTRRKRRNVKRAEDDRFVYDTLGEFEGYVDSEDYFGTSDVNLYKKVRREDDEDAMMKAAAGSEAEEICSGKNGKWRCKNASADNELHYCEKHYKDLELERKKLPPDEERCCQRNGITEGESGSWRCKNFRMGYGPAAADDDSVPKSRHCEKHYNYFANYKKKKSRDGEGGSANVGTKRKKKKLPPDEQRCVMTDGGGWRCKNFRMGHGTPADDDTVLKTRYCEKHYNVCAKYYEKHYYYYENLKKNKRSEDGEGAGSGPIEEETRGSRRRRRKKKVTEEEDDRFLDHACDSDTILGGGCAKIGAKRKKIETTSGELNSSTGVNEPVVELGSLDQVSVELELAEKELELAKMKLELEKKNAARDEDATEYWRNKCSDLEIVVLALEIEYLIVRYEDKSILRCEKLRNSEEIECEAQTRSLQNEISQTGEKQRNSKNDRSKSNAETNCEGRKNSSNVGTKRKKKLLPDEERCSLTATGGWRCKNLRMSHGAAAGDDTLPKSRYCEKHYNLCAKYYDNRKKKILKLKKKKEKDEQRCSHGRNGRRRCKNFRIGTHGAAADHDIVPKRSGDGEAGGCSATGPIECRSLTRRRKKVTEEDNRSLDVTGSMQPAASDDTSVTVVEGGTGNIRRKRKNVDDTPGESEDCDSYVDSENSVGDLMDMLGMENWNWNQDEMKWKSEADMLSSFKEDPLLLYL